MPIEFPFRKLPTRQTASMASGYIPDADLSRVEAALICVRTMNDLYQSVEANLSRFGLSVGRLGILILLHNSGEAGRTPSELADEGGITRATVTGLLDGLEKEGLVERIKHPGDRRMLHIRMTPKGRDLIAAVLPSHVQLIAWALGSLTEAEIQQLIALAEKIGTGSPPRT